MAPMLVSEETRRRVDDAIRFAAAPLTAARGRPLQICARVIGDAVGDVDPAASRADP
jgi:hypothetical protein